MMRRGWTVRWLGAVWAVSLLLSCEPPEVGNFEQDPNGASATGTVGKCNPQISDLDFLKGEWEDIGYYIRVMVSYKTRCYSDIDEGEVYIKVTNLDAGDPSDPSTYAEYRFGVAESTYVDYSPSQKKIWVDFLIPDEATTTTYLFTVKIKDNAGYWSDPLEGEVVYDDLEESVEGSDATPTPSSQ